MPTLNWIGKEAVVKHHKEVPFRLLEPVPELSCGPTDSGNLIVQGDNLHARCATFHATNLPVSFRFSENAAEKGEPMALRVRDFGTTAPTNAMARTIITAAPMPRARIRL